MFDDFKKYLLEKIDISDSQFDAIKRFLNFRAVKHGTLLQKPGDMNPVGYFVMKGCLRNYVIKKGKEHIIQFAPENWWIGANNAKSRPVEAGLFIDAVEDSKIAEFDHNFLRALDEHVPESREMWGRLEQNAFRSLENRIVHLLSSTAEERYDFFIQRYPNLSTRLPQKLIASYLGMTPQSLSRVRSGYFRTSA